MRWRRRIEISGGYGRRKGRTKPEDLAGWDLHDFPGSLDDITLFYVMELSEKDASDIVFLQIERQSVNIVWELDQLQSHHLLEPMHAGDAIAARDNGSHFAHHDAGIVVLYLLLDDLTDLFRSNGHSLWYPL